MCIVRQTRVLHGDTAVMLAVGTREVLDNIDHGDTTPEEVGSINSNHHHSWNRFNTSQKINLSY